MQRITSKNLSSILNRVLKGKVEWDINVENIDELKSVDMIKILDLEQEPVSKYVENVALKMNDIFKIETVRKLERRLSTFLQQSNAEILKNDN